MTRAEFDAISEDLIFQVHGDRSYDGFIRLGQSIAGAIIDHLDRTSEKHSARLCKFSNATTVLDFGAGVGRVLPHLMKAAPGAQFTAFDVDPRMLRCLRAISFERPINVASSTLDLESHTFDVIIAVSVFTHLDETADFWLSEIARLLSPRGVAYVTYQDESLFNHHKSIHVVSTDAVINDKFVLGRGTSEGGASMGTYYTNQAFKRFLSSQVDILEQVPRGLLGHQSSAIVAPCCKCAPCTEFVRGYARQLERSLYAEREHAADFRSNTSTHIKRLEEAVQVQAAAKSSAEEQLHAVVCEVRRLQRDVELFNSMVTALDDELRALRKGAPTAPAKWLYQFPWKKRPATSQEDVPTALTEAAMWYYFYDTPFRLYSRRPVILTGWCLTTSALPVSDVRVIADGLELPSEYGICVSNLFLPDGTTLKTAPAGFRLEIAFTSEGRHNLALQAKISGQDRWSTVIATPVWAV